TLSWPASCSSTPRRRARGSPRTAPPAPISRSCTRCCRRVGPPRPPHGSRSRRWLRPDRRSVAGADACATILGATPASEREPMTYTICEPCIDVKDRACVDECPVDCIYEGGRMLYIQPDECVDCGACEPVCPVTAIFYED